MKNRLYWSFICLSIDFYATSSGALKACACVCWDGGQRAMSVEQPQLEVSEMILSINSLEAADNSSPLGGRLWSSVS